jgi:transposase
MHQVPAYIQQPSSISESLPTSILSAIFQSVCHSCNLKIEYHKLRAEVGYWRALHRKALEREQGLKCEVEELKAKLRLRERQLYGRKTEQKSKRDGNGANSNPFNQFRRSRGQQPGAVGHGRRCHDELPIKEEVVDLPEEDKQCPGCGLPFIPFAGTEDAEVVEIEVRPYRRLIRRRRYQRGCTCQGMPRTITAPAPGRLIPKGKLGISVWVTVLLDKFLYYRPTHRLLADLRDHGLSLAQGTITGGLKYIAPLFDPIKTAILEKNQSEDRWQADETRYHVFEEIEGKVGYRWWLWVFCSQSTVVYVLDPFRAAKVPKRHFEEVEGGILLVDRYSAYKVLLKGGRILLAFCWAHVRRDFISIAKDWPAQQAWAMTWVEAIGKLYYLNDQRLEVQDQPHKFQEADERLKAKVSQMEKTATEQKASANLHQACHKVLKSLKRHWEGLTLFVDHPEIPMDNNGSERRLRGPAVGRKNYYGAGSKWSGGLAATMFTIFQSLLLWNLNPRTWLAAYLQACAQNNNQAPRDITGFLPWNMSQAQKSRFSKPPPWNDSS